MEKCNISSNNVIIFFVRHKCQKQLSFELEKSFRNEDFADVKARQYRDAPRNPTDRISGRRFRPYFIYLAFSVSGYQKCPDICPNKKVCPSSCGCFLWRKRCLRENSSCFLLLFFWVVEPSQKVGIRERASAPQRRVKKNLLLFQVICGERVFNCHQFMLAARHVLS